MVISKEITKAQFYYSDTERNLMIKTGPVSVSLGKVEMFSLMRFLIRICQYSWFRKIKNPQRRLKL